MFAYRLLLLVQPGVNTAAAKRWQRGHLSETHPGYQVVNSPLIAMNVFTKVAPFHFKYCIVKTTLLFYTPCKREI